MTAALLACGVDERRSVLFQQSHVHEHAELAWILNCTTRLGALSRMTQFKSKSGDDRDTASVGLFTYPVLMCADILLYKATAVPVGDDQRQHVELARDVVASFNSAFATKCLVEPAPLFVAGAATRTMSLRDGTKKMSKSEPSDATRINLTDSPDAIAAKVRRRATAD
jgi:tryptophanyl-tRNA synthetase